MLGRDRDGLIDVLCLDEEESADAIAAGDLRGVRGGVDRSRGPRGLGGPGGFGGEAPELPGPAQPTVEDALGIPTA